MTVALAGSAVPGRPSAAPVLEWPALVSKLEAVELVAARLPTARDLSGDLHHHPLAGVVVGGRRRTAFPSGTRNGEGTAEVCPVLVDTVSGRAYLTEPWDTAVPASEAALRAVQNASHVLNDDEIRDLSIRIVAAALMRRRRLGGHHLFVHDQPVRIAKPNWWVTGVRHGRPVEVLVDAITGRHYAVRA